MEKADKQPAQVIIVGAGFGGLEAAKKLACKDVRLTIIDRTNYHLFQPLLYQVATAALSYSITTTSSSLPAHGIPTSGMTSGKNSRRD